MDNDRGAMNQKKRLHPAVAALIVVVLVGIVASAVIIINNNKSDTADTQNQTSAVTDPATIDASDTSSYEDGTYRATGSYMTPGGTESIELTVVIKDGVISDTSIANNATDPEAVEHQELFSDNYKALVVGKPVGSVSLSRVAGSSLTSNGFNDALDQIKEDARA